MNAIVSRRHLLSGTALVAVGGAAAALVGCNPTVTADLAKAGQYAKIVAEGLNTIIGIIGNLIGMSAATVARYGNYVAQAMALAVSIGAAASDSAAQPLVQQFEAVVSAALGALDSSTGILPAIVISALKDIAAVLPEIMTVVGLFTAASSRPAAFAAAVSPDVAVQNLRNFIAANKS